MQRAKQKLPNLAEEQKLWRYGYRFVIGLDEAGRGPLAGPVCAAAVCIAANLKFSSFERYLVGRKIKDFKIKDSKKLSAKQRETWYEILTTHHDINLGIGIISEKVIDKINIFEATKLAMKKAIELLKVSPEFLLIDGTFILEDLQINQKAVKRGDEKIFSCAAASIIAKVTRDRLMMRYAKKYPEYNFEKHKGYGTKQHFAALKKYGPCSIHRLTFAPLKKSHQ